MATKNKPHFKIGDGVKLRATVTVPDGDERTGADCVVVMLEGHNVPVRLSVDTVKKAGRSERMRAISSGRRTDAVWALRPLHGAESPARFLARPSGAD
jgi:hypothetical protein